MKHRPQPLDPNAPVAVLDIGNTSIHLGRWQRGQVSAQLAVPARDAAAFEEAFAAQLATFPTGPPPAVVACSVVPEALRRVRALVEARIDRKLLVVGEAVPYPLDVAASLLATVGADRVCAAGAAYDRLQAACVVVDFGTAVTIDLVDDDGTMVGGAILPGLRLQMRALHEHTAMLPLVEPGVPEMPYGRNTVEAIQTGVCRGLAGAVRDIVEGYATFLNRWPQVVATGGDLAFMARPCNFLDSLVPDLTLRGVGLAHARRLGAGSP
ncbi:MAG TPA: type III pantothenate kinase [Phycisphaerae bacterium]|nr:type III pantothenate kinase [Phycisphaerae bacterium]HNU46429.1 type III pantothenate kinase [Phycisphaerae bacterium]